VTRERVVSVVTIHEIYEIVLEREGREVAELRVVTIRRARVLTRGYTLILVYPCLGV